MLLLTATRSAFPKPCPLFVILPTHRIRNPNRQTNKTKKNDKNSPFFVFETPTLSNHSQDWGDEFSDTATGNRSRCSSCGSGGGGSGSRARARSPRRKTAGRDGQRSSNDTPPACYRDHFPRQQQERHRSISPSRRAGDANGVSASAAAGKRQAKRAASLLYSSLRFAAAVKSETLPPGECADLSYRKLSGVTGSGNSQG